MRLQRKSFLKKEFRVFGGEYRNWTGVHGFVIRLHFYFQILINVLNGVKIFVHENVYGVLSINAILFVIIPGTNVKNFKLGRRWKSSGYGLFLPLGV